MFHPFLLADSEASLAQGLVNSPCNVQGYFLSLYLYSKLLCKWPSSLQPSVVEAQQNRSNIRSSKFMARGVGGTVVCESALRSAGTFCRGFEPRHRRPGLTEGFKT
ncbi:hypothetical protein PoB_002690700 [Plakobranchus ocellatus]|uniref:Uncharacterized protein n=1 Tax=Plakobranchus ocellatus TaxID=259542 RepID=A0AAV4A0L7_9GAST|nr:hypothetical protein PoB_002690700 [Plakobranchus ocellatus]